MDPLKGKKVLVGVTGGIAAYKAVELVRRLKKHGAEVKVILTPFAEKFVNRLTFETLTGNKVFIDWQENPLTHINLSRWADVFLIAPCTVNTLSKIASGIGDNLLTTTVLAYKGNLILAPAANPAMYNNPAVKENREKLKKRGITIVEPEYGILACEEEGEGKLANEEKILEYVRKSLSAPLLKDKKVLITCGATREYMDPVRFISNESSGEMGFSLARVCWWFSAQVKVIAGFTTAQAPFCVEIVKIRSAQELRAEVLKELNNTDILIMNAAVADYKPVRKENKKLSKKSKLTLELEKTPDILEEVGRLKKNTLLIGFALESEDLINRAKEKLKRKNLDMIIANPPEVMGAKYHKGFLITSEKIEEFVFGSKLESAFFIIKRLTSFISS